MEVDSFTDSGEVKRNVRRRPFRMRAAESDSGRLPPEEAPDGRGVPANRLEVCSGSCLLSTTIAVKVRRTYPCP